ncbi:MAG TPA: PKD domain-containing protein, partial [Candidatus Angelobacter sp.]|nr:PKD domain-containing protein [Candidatus Angelobacter sp.]
MSARSVIFQILLLSVFFLPAAAQTHFNPTTTLTAETGNNTSAADNFAAQPNGNMSPGNVSKVPLQSLLYPGSTAKLYAHLVQWFGYGDHVDVGYVSGDAFQVQKQVADMISRGLDGAIIDWYGRGEQRKTFRAYDMGTQLLMHEAEQHPGFSFALMVDVGANKDCEREHGCDPTENLIEDLNYAYRTYEQSSAYLKANDRPVVFFFGQVGHGINWHRVRMRVAGNPLFIFRNSGAFGNEASDGAFSWVSPLQANEKDPMALNYLVNYYATAQRHDPKFSLGTAYKGFDDSIALWGEKRHINQQCGQTWLQSIAEASQFYSEKQQMLGIQLVTWNDYEEGTEFETGISNCVKLASWTRGASVFWNVKGDASTVDHFTVFVSQDGENLMPIADLAADTRSLNLGAFTLDKGDYTVYVKAIGKPSLSNEMSEGRRITISRLQQTAAAVHPLDVRLSVTSAPAPASVVVTVRGVAFLPNQTIIDFGDGTVMTGQISTQHVYKLPGVYTVMVTIINGAGMRTTQTAAI